MEMKFIIAFIALDKEQEFVKELKKILRLRDYDRRTQFGDCIKFNFRLTEKQYEKYLETAKKLTKKP